MERFADGIVLYLVLQAWLALLGPPLSAIGSLVNLHRKTLQEARGYFGDKHLGIFLATSDLLCLIDPSLSKHKSPKSHNFCNNWLNIATYLFLYWQKPIIEIHQTSCKYNMSSPSRDTISDICLDFSFYLFIYWHRQLF